jgi:nicotinamide-nucleotide amidase
MTQLFPDDITQAAESVLAAARAKRLKIATAESCTGGLISGALTEIAGSSDVFDRGFVTYSNEAKAMTLGVATKTLRMRGAVSRETAAEMAIGALARSEADVAVAVTGLAGPSGADRTGAAFWTSRPHDCPP